jgi:trehalose 6-phosphate synthase/phosphatase
MHSAHWNYKEPDPEKIWDCGGKEHWWQTYCQVNELFRDRVVEMCQLKDGDVLWVHDYHLMLLPSLVRNRVVCGAGCVCVCGGGG